MEFLSELLFGTGVAATIGGSLLILSGFINLLLNSPFFDEGSPIERLLERLGDVMCYLGGWIAMIGISAAILIVISMGLHKLIVLI